MTDIAQTVAKQRDFFRTGATLPVRFRLEALDKLRRAIKQYEPQLLEAMQSDLGKSASEAYMCEVGLTLSEISHVRSHLRRWARPSLRWTPLTNFPALSQVRHDPYGVTLIMSPWNYPVLLTLEPLVGALAAGNCACVKPSAYSPATSEVIARLIAETFPPEYVAVITGGRQENQTLLDQTFDYIFFTGGVNVGRMVMERASRHLTPSPWNWVASRPSSSTVTVTCAWPPAASPSASGSMWVRRASLPTTSSVTVTCMHSS